ncbi:dnaJ homolog subfamily C member 7-like [Antedon mediterranea]|uniref:dnaJ homolog subfamily C member 7-like n=1 Tax=Antedon mediterranea TaxID=105859 RepID=UPI003AF8C636
MATMDKEVEIEETTEEITIEMEENEEEPMEEEQEEEDERTPEEKAEDMKKEGNSFYVQKEYLKAIDLYTEAINLCPKCASYYGNRAACYIMLDKFKDGLEDARTAVRLDPSFLKGHLREAKCHLALGEVDGSIRSLEEVMRLDSNNKQAKNELVTARACFKFISEGKKAYEKEDFRKVLFCMERAISLAPACSRFKVQRAESLVLLKRYGEAQVALNELLQRDGMNADAIYVRGLCFYYEDIIDKAIQHFQQTLRLAPDHTKSRLAFKKCKSLKVKKEEGNTAFKSGKNQLAYDLYTEALQIDPLNVFTNAKIYLNRAIVGTRLGKTEQAIEDCSKAIELDPKYTKAYLKRAKCFMETELFEEAVRDYEKVYEMQKTKEHRMLLQDAKLELKKSKRKDYYKILSVSKNANEDEIKKAYRKHALLHHPDRHASKSVEERKEEEVKFKEVGEAYNILSDAKKKYRYDSGQDLEDMSNGFADFDANNLFQAFFSGGGGHSHHHHGHSFPHGFSFQFG